MPSPVLVPGTSPARLDLVADHFEGRFDPRVFRARFPHLPVLSANPLVIEPERGVYVYLARFGVAVFWNASEALVDALRADLAVLLGTRSEQVGDRLTVHAGGAEDRVDFAEVTVGELTLDKLKVISLALAQSVALDHFEGTVREAMGRFEPVVRDLRERGRFSLPYREALKLIGFTLSVREAVLQDLTLFDDPPETWESESLASLDGAIFSAFDLEERLGAIQKKLLYLSDAGARIMDVLTTRKNHRMEWIVIILIAVETLFFLLDRFPGLR
jgi:required for meiotic nuclear division protein 1